jgi:ribosomal protein L11 methyltransferase
VRVGPLWVGPPWEEPPAGATAVVIDPGRAFGTGAHPTTRLCIGFLLDLPRGSLLDVGCGSGVLAIAAAKLGFAPVLAVDEDAAAIEAAGSNARANDVAIETLHADAFARRLPAGDAAVANITRGAVEQALERVDAERVVTSGYLAAEQPSSRRFTQLERRVDEGWAADLWAARRE